MNKNDILEKHFPVSPKTSKGRERSRPAEDPVFPGQHEGEEVQFIFRQHPVVLRRPLIFGLVAILLAILPLDFPFVYGIPWLSRICLWIAGGVSLAVVLAWFYYWSLWYYSCTIVTIERIVFLKQKGLFNREVNSLFHGRIHSLDYQVKGLYATVMGFGDLLFQTEVGNFVVKFIPRVTSIQQKILGVIRDNRDSDDWNNESFEVM